MKFEIQQTITATESDFIKYWEALYQDTMQAEYSNHIVPPLTDDKLRALFKWKNGGTVAQKKLNSIEKNYIPNRPPPSDLSTSDLIEFISGEGGAIWRIFWLHCEFPKRYPIFDQHVYRAMMMIRTEKIAEIPSSNTKKARIYVEEYLPFYKALAKNEKKLRDTDKALWTYGKFLKTIFSAKR